MGWELVVAQYMRSFILMGGHGNIVACAKNSVLPVAAANTRVITGRLAGEKSLLDI